MRRATSAPADTDRAPALIRDLFPVEHDAMEEKLVRPRPISRSRAARSRRVVEEFFRQEGPKNQPPSCNALFARG
jgi:hypothetical protein